MKRRRVILGLVFLCLAAGLGWLVVRRTAVQIFALPDGSRVFLRGVTVGTNVPMNFGSGLDKMLARVPGKAGARFRRNVWTDESDKPEQLVFWFEFERARLPDSIVDVEFVDWNYRRTNWAVSWLPVQTLPNGRMIATCGFQNWPRGEKRLSMQILLEEPASDPNLEGNAVKIGEVTVKNPGYRP